MAMVLAPPRFDELKVHFNAKQGLGAMLTHIFIDR